VLSDPRLSTLLLGDVGAALRPEISDADLFEMRKWLSSEIPNGRVLHSTFEHWIRNWKLGARGCRVEPTRRWYGDIVRQSAYELALREVDAELDRRGLGRFVAPRRRWWRRWL
jgi:hypothetical protein